ncbi:unnamed protein product [Schistosoma mattheei]|uniref:Uncharacterized protein n=1 Tax=Schistosoma mattheei TaxID=31246 RepID=A0A183PYG9_9TREM|nr:unnamed protein product [Schistosoma mattheei]
MDPPYPPTWLNRWTFAFCPLNFINNINTVNRTSLEVYPVNKIYKDLLDLAAYLLYPNGRLVFWIPVLRSEFIGVKSLPHHPSFRLLAACEQVSKLFVVKKFSLLINLMLIRDTYFDGVLFSELDGLVVELSSFF